VIVDDIAGLRRILPRHRTSRSSACRRTGIARAIFAAKYHAGPRYRIIPVNPMYRRCSASAAIRTSRRARSDRRGRLLPASRRDAGARRAAVACGAKVFWMQLGIRHDEAARIASEGGSTSCRIAA
jgi:hypothetical protein